MKRGTLKPSPLLDDRVWLELLEPLFQEDPSQADRAAKLWHRLLAEIESGQKALREPLGALRMRYDSRSRSLRCIRRA
jgi:hypothetical protein